MAIIQPKPSIQRGKWCLGHGVHGQAESLRTGHYVEAHLMDSCFSTRDGAARASKGFARTSEPRCRLCRSIRNWHDHHASALKRARRFRREHAHRWVKHGRCRTLDEILLEMDVGGITEQGLADMLLAQLGERCPGLCAHEENRVIVFHTIDCIADMHIDVRDPTAPFSIENLGILCNSCNQAKSDMPWPVFIHIRRTVLRMWQATIDRPDYRRPEQLGFGFD